MEGCKIILSVICPVYNEIKYIDVCIQSILLQDYPQENIEILFVDGMSTDGTRDSINGYARINPFTNIHTIPLFSLSTIILCNILYNFDFCEKNTNIRTAMFINNAIKFSFLISKYIRCL